MKTFSAEPLTLSLPILLIDSIKIRARQNDVLERSTGLSRECQNPNTSALPLSFSHIHTQTYIMPIIGRINTTKRLKTSAVPHTVSPSRRHQGHSIAHTKSKLLQNCHNPHSLCLSHLSRTYLTCDEQRSSEVQCYERRRAS